MLQISEIVCSKGPCRYMIVCERIVKCPAVVRQTSRKSTRNIAKRGLAGRENANRLVYEVEFIGFGPVKPTCQYGLTEKTNGQHPHAELTEFHLQVGEITLGSQLRLSLEFMEHLVERVTLFRADQAHRSRVKSVRPGRDETN